MLLFCMLHDQTSCSVLAFIKKLDAGWRPLHALHSFYFEHNHIIIGNRCEIIQITPFPILICIKTLFMNTFKGISVTYMQV